MSTTRPCPDCEGRLQPIRLIDKTEKGAHSEHEYADAEATRGFWLGRYQVEGRVEAVMCDRCGRILLYGRPAAGATSTGDLAAESAESRLLSEPTVCLRCGEMIPAERAGCPACGWSWESPEASPDAAR